MYEFKKQIQYKCKKYGIEFVEAHRRFPSSKTCSCCGQIKSDLKLLKIIFSNLIDNAIKYGATESPVVVTASLTKAKVKVSVINQAHKARMPDPKLVFTKHYRAAWAHQQVGSGLGLYLIAQLAKMLGGQLRYIPQGQQVNFELCLKQSA